MPFDGAGFATGEYVQKIDAMIDLIGTPERWGKGSFRTPDGRYCLRAAIRAIDRDEVLAPMILEAIDEVTGRHHWGIEPFNDHPQTDHQQVIAVLMRARQNVGTGRFVVAPKSALQRGWWSEVMRRLGFKSPEHG